MAIVIIGGHTRNVGKTSVVAGIIQALPEMDWTAFKVTQYGHGICSADGAECDCASHDHSWAVTEERDRGGETDTSRFLLAGAKRVYWARTRQGYLAEAVPKVRQILDDSENVIFESNSLMKFIRPDLYLPVLNFENADFKDSALEFLDRADAIIVHANFDGTNSWNGVSPKLYAKKATFEIHPPQYVTPEIINFVRNRIAPVAEKPAPSRPRPVS